MVVFCGWSYFFRSFYICYKVKSNTCKIFLPIFLIHCFNQVATNFTFNSETSVRLLLPKCLPSNATKSVFVKIVEHKLEEVFFDGIRRGFQLGHFILVSVPIFQQLPRLTSLYFVSFLNWPLKLDCTFRWQQSNGFEHLGPAESWKLFSCKSQVTMHSSCNFHPSYLPINLCSFYWGVRTLLLWTVRTHFVLLSSYANKIVRISIFIWKQLVVTG